MILDLLFELALGIRVGFKVLRTIVVLSIEFDILSSCTGLGLGFRLVN